MPVTILRKIRSFFRQPLFLQLWFAPTWILLGLSRLAILTLSFQRLAQYLGSNIGNLTWLPLLSTREEWLAIQLGRTIQMASRYTPWSSNCFAQAIAARLMLGWYGVPYITFFGVMRDPEQHDLKAHAWVAAGRVSVCGGYSFNQFVVVGSFVSRQFTDLAGDRPNVH